MVILWVIGIFYIALCVISWWWLAAVGTFDNCKTRWAKVLYRHGEYTAYGLILFVIWTMAHAAGHVLAGSLMGNW